jgi:two-component system response regulator MprA
VNRNGRPIQLTVREYDLLLQLLRQPNRVQQRLSLLHAVWGEPFVGDDNLLDVYIRYLRRKIEPPGEAKLIHTVRGVGFMLKASRSAGAGEGGAEAEASGSSS